MQATPRQANHAIAMLSKMLSLAERWGLRPLNSNPCRHLRRYPEVQRTRYPLPEELERIGAALREAEADGTLRPEVAACIKFLALSGARLSEAIGLELSTVDFRTGAWSLADAKTGARMAMLGAPALAVLANLSRTGGRAFPSVNVDMVERAWAKLRERAAAPDLRLHDLRHGVGTLRRRGRAERVHGARPARPPDHHDGRPLREPARRPAARGRRRRGRADRRGDGRRRWRGCEIGTTALRADDARLGPYTRSTVPHRPPRAHPLRIAPSGGRPWPA